MEGYEDVEVMFFVKVVCIICAYTQNVLEYIKLTGYLFS